METCSGSNRFSLVDGGVDFLSVCEHIAHDVEEVVKRGNLLNESQCRDLSSKLLQTVDSIRGIKGVVGGSFGSTFSPFLRILYQSLDKAKTLVSGCAQKDWAAEAVFQVQNESSFQEILLNVRLCYKAIYDNVVINLGIPVLLSVKDAENSLHLGPASDSAIESDQEDLRRRLEQLATDSMSVRVFGYFRRNQVVEKQCLARHLLKKFSCVAQACLSNPLDVCKAGLWDKEMEPPETWGSFGFLGSGAGTSGVLSTKWLGVPSARKEFHGSDLKASFLNEARILSHLKHPRIVNFICCGNGEEKGDRFIAMELMEESLSDLIDGRKGVYFALPVAVDIIVQIAEGMRYLHDQGVAHRDLKPRNVVVKRLASTYLGDQYYCAKLVDFGLSKSKVEVSKSDTVSFAGVGTPRYRAPEVYCEAHCNGLGKAKWFRVDVYSFAITCAHVLSLKAPFKGMGELSELYARLLEGERPELPSGLPGELADILRECWDTDPKRRPSFVKICSRLYLLRFKVLGGNSMSARWLTTVREETENFAKKDSCAKRIGEGMGDLSVSSSLGTGESGYYSAGEFIFSDGDDSAGD